MKRLMFRILLTFAMTLAITPSTLVLVANSVTASDAAAEATDAANAATDAANLAAEAADSTTSALRDRIDSALALANSAGIVTIVDIGSGITACNNKIASMTTKRDFAKSQYDRIQIILSDLSLESSIKLMYNSASRSWLVATTSYQSVINLNEREKLYLNSAQTQINTVAGNKVAAVKAAADAKAAADKAVADKAAADKAVAEKDAAIAALTAKVTAIEAKLAATKKTTITCVKGKLSKKVTAVKPKCPTGYKLKK